MAVREFGRGGGGLVVAGGGGVGGGGGEKDEEDEENWARSVSKHSSSSQYVYYPRNRLKTPTVNYIAIALAIYWLAAESACRALKDKQAAAATLEILSLRWLHVGKVPKVIYRRKREKKS